MRPTRTACALLALAAWPALARPPRAGAEEPTPSAAEALVASVAPALVELRFTLVFTYSLEGQSGVERMASDAIATVVDPSGLVMASDSLTGGPRSPAMGMIRSMLPGLELKLDLEDLRVSLGDGTEELPALLVLRDGRNDLAWIQVLDLGERRLPAVDLAAGRDPLVGEPLASVGRLGSGFGHAPYYVRGRVTSLTERPRRNWNVATDAEDAGLLHFAAAGTPVGFLAYLTGAEGTQGGGVELRLLPLDVAKKSRDAAKARVADEVAKARAAKEPEKR